MDRRLERERKRAGGRNYVIDGLSLRCETGKARDGAFARVARLGQEIRVEGAPGERYNEDHRPRRGWSDQRPTNGLLRLALL